MTFFILKLFFIFLQICLPNKDWIEIVKESKPVSSQWLACRVQLRPLSECSVWVQSPY